MRVDGIDEETAMMEYKHWEVHPKERWA